jgi:hypothetical protein
MAKKATIKSRMAESREYNRRVEKKYLRSQPKSATAISAQQGACA